MNLLKALATISSMTLVSRILGFVRDTVIARAFGAGLATDAFFVAFRIPNLLRRPFAGGALLPGVVPFLARLFAVPTEMFEAARIDGARFFRLHRHITVPQLATVIVFYVVVEAITMVSWVFNYVYVMTNGQGGPGDATQVTELYIYQTAFQYSSPEIAAAAAVTLFGATLVLIAIFFRIQRRAGVGVVE